MESAIYWAELVLFIEQLAVLDVHFELMLLKNLERKGTTYYELVYQYR